MESLFHKDMTFPEILSTVKTLARHGLLTASLIANIVFIYKLNQPQKEALEQVPNMEQVERMEDASDNNWELVADDVTATVYNAVPAQCNKDVQHTASMFKLDLKNVLSHRIIAMERTMMKEFGLKYGDVVKIEGTGKWDGVWQIQDTMNKRFAGQHKIDILVPNDIKYGKWDGIRVYVPGNEETRAAAVEKIG